MPMRSSSLANNPLAITRELDGRYDVVLQVRDNLDLIEQVAGIDFATILAELESAQDFTGITVVQGETVAWDAVNKILTVPKGDKGDKGDTGNTGLTGPQGIQGPQGIKGNTGLKGDTGSQGPKGFDGAVGAQGLKGDTGDDLTITQITYNGNGTFNWLFSDGTTYVTPDLKGPKGDTGDQGIKGDQGISVHHLKGTSTTNPNGDFGTSPFRDTYTFYGDADETLNLGWFVVTNGVSDGMSTSVYDTNGNGVVDNSERLGGELPSHYVNVTTDQTVSGNKTFTGDVVVQGDLTVSGNVVSVDVETVTVKDNLIVLNSGEVGAGVTAGEAGIVVDRGTESDYKFVFDEVSDSFKVGQEGSLQKVATREDAPVDGGVAIWDTVDNRFETTKNVAVDTVSIGGHAVSWNTDESTLDVVLNGATLQVGQEQLIRVTNNSGTSINDGTAVMATGTLGNSGRITVAKANLTQANAKFILGVVTETIASGADGFVTAFGKVRGIQTNGVNYGETWVDGDVLYVKDSGNGALTKVVPTDTQVKLPIAIVIHAHNNGTIFVRVNSIDENHAKAELALKANINSPTLVTPNIGVATGTSFNSITGLASVVPLIAGTASVGTSTLTARQDHVHPVQTTVSGNAGTATTLATARNITLSGDVSGTTSFNGSADASIVVSVADNSHAHTIANVTGLQSTLDAKVDDSEKGAANGVATLDVNGKVVLTQIPDSVLGQLEYQGVWDFTTLPTSTQKGQYWIASVSGNGYEVGDWAVWNGVSFDKVDNTDAVATVAGRTGNVVLTKSDVGLSNVNNTADANKNVLSATKLTTARTINGVSFDGTANITITDNTKLPVGGKAADSELLDGINSSQFIRSDITTTVADGPLLYGQGAREILWLNNLTGTLSLGYGYDNVLIQNNKAWHEGNDGAGSGLDADKLDNRQATDFMYSQNAGTVTDLNNLLQSGCYRINNTEANRPAGVDYGNILVMHGGASDTATQLVTDYESNNIYWRSGSGYVATWQPWRRILSDGNALTTAPLGYASSVGVGGVVIQDTNKGANVVINKLTGLVTTANSALAAGASIGFNLINSLLGISDHIIITPYYGYIPPTNYKIEVVSTWDGTARIVITNNSTGSLSDIVQFKFQIVKGAIS